MDLCTSVNPECRSVSKKIFNQETLSGKAVIQKYGTPNLFFGCTDFD
jgi:hypothetical protein